MECSLALGVVAETRGSIAAWQAACTLPWIGVNDSDSDSKRTLRPDCRNRQISSLAGKKKLTGAQDPRHMLQKSGGLADQWNTDDGDIMCHPILLLPFEWS